MAEDKNSSSDDVKKKLPIVPILIGVLVVLVVAVGAVFATLMLTGGFSDEDLESELAEIESAATGAQSSAAPDGGIDDHAQPSGSEPGGRPGDSRGTD